ncbi:MAG: cytochrome P450, partial [Chloroflexota bacterium]
MVKTPPGPAENFYYQLKTLRADFLAYLVNATRSYGSVVRLNPGPGTYLYLLNHPDLTRQVLVSHADQFRKSAMTQKMVRRFLGNGLILNEGESHKRQRKLTQPAFQKKRVESYAESMVELTEQEMAKWRSGETFDFEKSMVKLTMHIVARTLFGTRVYGGTEKVGQIMEIFADAISGQFRALPLPEWMPIPRHLRQRAAVAQMDELIARMVTDWRKGGKDHGDLMSMLLLARDEDTGEGMDGQQLRDELVSTYFAGHETVAKLMSWVVYLLTQHPAVA